MRYRVVQISRAGSAIALLGNLELADAEAVLNREIGLCGGPLCDCLDPLCDTGGFFIEEEGQGRTWNA